MSESVDELVEKLADIVAENTSIGVGNITDKLCMALAKRDRESLIVQEAEPSYLVKRARGYVLNGRDRIALASDARELRRQGCTIREISEALSCSTGWVSYALHKAQYAEGL